MPIVAPTVNSYKRLVENFWAPVTVSWGLEHRAASIRLIAPPTASPKATRFEVRVAGADGKEAVWHCELASRSVLARNGLTEKMFAIGKHVRITGSQARQNPTGCAVREAHFDDGSVWHLFLG